LLLPERFVCREGVAAAIGGAVAYGAVGLAKFATASALPTLMSYTATVVAGVGSIQAGFIAPLAAFAAVPVGMPVAIGGAIAVGIVTSLSNGVG
jgi:hypothetical protein